MTTRLRLLETVYAARRYTFSILVVAALSYLGVIAPRAGDPWGPAILAPACLLVGAAAGWILKRPSPRHLMADVALKDSEAQYRMLVSAVRDHAIYTVDT